MAQNQARVQRAAQEAAEETPLLTLGGQRVLFLCTHNSSRSQMAEGLLQTRGGNRYTAFSAGTHPRTVHPLAIRAMAELGIDISEDAGHYAKRLDTFQGQTFDLVVTVCDDAAEAMGLTATIGVSSPLELGRWVRLAPEQGPGRLPQLQPEGCRRARTNLNNESVSPALSIPLRLGVTTALKWHRPR